MPRFKTRRPSSQIYFDVVLSATYQLPVLYFDVRDALGQGDRSIDGIYSALVPETIRPQVEQVGIRGAISMAVSTANERRVKSELTNSRIIHSQTLLRSSCIRATLRRPCQTPKDHK